MRFNYLKLPILDPKTRSVIGEIYRPYVQIMLSYGHRISPAAVNCLVDSGSDYNLFPASLGEILGIPIKKGRLTRIDGIGNIRIEAFRHQVRLYLGTNGFLTNIDFAYEQTTPLLGRTGFFNHFKRVVFDETHRVLETEPA